MKKLYCFEPKELKAAASLAGKEKGHPVLACVHVESCGDGGTRVMATDSYVFGVFASEWELDEASAWEANIPAAHCAGLKASDKRVCIEPKDGGTLDVTIVGARGAERREIWGTVEGNYARWRDIFPADPERVKGTMNWIKVRADLLSKAMKAATAGGAEHMGIAYQDSAMKPLIASGKTDAGLFVCLVMPVRNAELGPWYEAQAAENGAELKRTIKEQEDVIKAAQESEGCAEEVARLRAELDAAKREAEEAKQEAEEAKQEAMKHEAEETEAEQVQEAEEPRDLTPERNDGLVTVREWVESLAGVHVDTVGAWLWVTGDTRAHKDALKAAGFRYSAKKEAWYYKPEGSAPKTRRARYSTVEAVKAAWEAA